MTRGAWATALGGLLALGCSGDDFSAAGKPAAGAGGQLAATGSGGTSGDAVAQAGAHDDGGSASIGGGDTVVGTPKGGGAGATAAGTDGTGTDVAGAGTGSTGGANSSGGTGSAGKPSIAEICERAHGAITIGEGTLVADGDTFTLSDGMHGPSTFEFDINGGGLNDSAHQAIVITGNENEAALAILIAAAINGIGAMLTIGAATNALAPDEGSEGAAGAGGALSVPSDHTTETVKLTNEFSGARGNVAIKDTVGNPSFRSSGMDNGTAVACSAPASCNSDDECDRKRHCASGHVCE